METIDGDWIRAHLTGERGELAALARHMGIDSAKLSKVLAGVRQMRAAEVLRAAEYFRSRGVEVPAAYRGVAAPPPEPHDMIPVHDVAASAGSGLLVADGEAPSWELRFPAGYLRELTGADPRAVRSLSVRGDSMEPTLRDGDLVLIDTAAQGPLHEGVYVLRLDDTLLVKRVGRAGPGRLLLISDNRAYPPGEYPASEVAVIGRVIAAVVRM